MIQRYEWGNARSDTPGRALAGFTPASGPPFAEQRRRVQACSRSGIRQPARFSSAWGIYDILDTTLVQPGLVPEISTDTAIDRGGVYRHPIRYVRLRLHLDASREDVPQFGRAWPRPPGDPRGRTRIA